MRTDKTDRMITKEDVKAIAERMAAKMFADVPGEIEYGKSWKMAGVRMASALLPHILSLMARVKHANDCMVHQPEWMGAKCTCGLSDELKSIESLIHPTT